MRHLVAKWDALGITVVRQSSLYVTTPIGGGRQPPFLNAVLILRTPHPPARLIRLFKVLEREAGRRKGRLDGPRPLDIDLIDHAGRVVGWPARRTRAHYRRPFLVLPHPEMHRRRFVLVPLAEIAPGWRHPVLDASALSLSRRLGPSHGAVRRVLDSGWVSCEKVALGDRPA